MRTRIIIATFIITCCLVFLLSFVTSQSFKIDTVVGHRFYDGEGGLASHVGLMFPHSVAFHPVTGDLFIVDMYNHVIRKVDKASGVITTVAGTPGVQGYAGDDGPAIQALLFYPTSIAFSLSGQSMFIADSWNNRVRRVQDGIIATVAGNGGGAYGFDGALATNTPLFRPASVAILPTTGELLISESFYHRIRKVRSNGFLTTIAGTGVITNAQGSNLGDNGPATSATLNNPEGIAVNMNGEVFIADRGNGRVRKVGLDGVITTIAGTGTEGFIGDNGPATSAQLGSIKGLAIDGVGDLFIADFSGHCIRRVVKTTQIITTVAGICGTANGGYSGENVPVNTTKLNVPTGVAVGSDGEIVIADQFNHRIRKVSTNGIIHTIVGYGVGDSLERVEL